jgi:hypothetical protein
VVALLGLAACQDRQPAEAVVSSGSDIRGMVTGAAARGLGADGRFAVTGQPAATSRAKIDQATAVGLATAYMHDLAPGLQPSLEREHQAPIALASAQPCDRVFYAESPYGDFPDSIPAVYARTHGPWWLVTFCTGATPVVSVSVSAYDTHLSVKRGHLVYPLDQIQGQEFWAFGIPNDQHPALPLPPEDAVRLVSQLTGRLVIEPPTLITPSLEEGPPQTARWRVRLDHPVSLRKADGTGAVTTDQVFARIRMIGETVSLEAATPGQPAARSVKWTPTAVFRAWASTPAKTRPRQVPRSITALSRKPTVPTVFDRVSALVGR